MPFVKRLLGAVAFACSSAAVAQGDYAIVGDAYDLDNTERLLYSEHYTAPDEEGRVEVLYTLPGGDTLAEKTLNIQTGKLTPSYRLTDRINGGATSIDVKSETLMLTKDEGGKSETTRLEHHKLQVVDAGFAALVRQRWEALAEGQSIDFHFALPAKGRNIELRLQNVAADKTPFDDRQADWRTYEMVPTNGLIRLFADPVYLAFDAEKYLMRYAGRSNLSGPDGNPMDVLIRYRYHSVMIP